MSLSVYRGITVDYIFVMNGTVVGYPRPLPISFANVSNFHLLSSDKLMEHGWYPVRFVPNPNKTQNSVVTGQQFVVEGNEVVQYEQIREKTQDELDAEKQQQWETIREQRNQLLYECDWTQLSDSPLTSEQKTEWSLYRQSLRDVTTQEDPFNIDWPIKP